MAHDHSIEPGTHLAWLAYVNAHGTIDAIWQHPNNAALRDQRPDPGVLAVGDVVHVPDAPPRVHKSLRTRRRHEIVVELPMPHLRLKLLRPGDVPYAGVQCRLAFDGGSTRITTDEHGNLEVELDPETRTVELSVQEVELTLDVAHLQPVDTLDGLVGRLENLGYRPGAVEEGAVVDEYALRSAIEEFQCDHGLEVDGDPGDKTRDALVEAHGA